MKYICQICGYIYDEEKEGASFDKLPENWTCPWCGASKENFKPEQVQTVAKKVIVKPIKNDMQKLSFRQMSVLCSNLARGSEKQYKQEESELFKKLADYYSSISEDEPNASIDVLKELLAGDMDNLYVNARSTGEKDKDRGALRVCTWGEKVTNIQKSLLEQYNKYGDAIFENKEVWVCSICGFIYIGDNPPALCPVCKVPEWKFDKIERRINK